MIDTDLPGGSTVHIVERRFGKLAFSPIGSESGSMKTNARHNCLLLAAALAWGLTGCQQADDSAMTYDDQSWEEETWQAEAVPGQPTEPWQQPGPGQEPPPLVDDYFIVEGMRQFGGEIYEDSSDISRLDGRPRKRRTPLRFIIHTRGNNTGQTATYELPEMDFRVIREDMRLQKSTLARWEQLSGDQLPSETEGQTGFGTTGERPFQVLDSGHIAY